MVMSISVALDIRESALQYRGGLRISPAIVYAIDEAHQNSLSNQSYTRLKSPAISRTTSSQRKNWQLYFEARSCEVCCEGVKVRILRQQLSLR
jgi:hypothetical protein